jgi:cell division protein FtsN
MMYRVRIGPATDQAMLDKWQKTLSGMGITPLAVRM